MYNLLGMFCLFLAFQHFPPFLSCWLTYTHTHTRTCVITIHIFCNLRGIISLENEELWFIARISLQSTTFLEGPDLDPTVMTFSLRASIPQREQFCNTTENTHCECNHVTASICSPAVDIKASSYTEKPLFLIHYPSNPIEGIDCRPFFCFSHFVAFDYRRHLNMKGSKDQGR